jgi:hypothetical protein
MYDVDFILKKGRFRITFWILFPLLIQIFGLSVIVFIMLLKTEELFDNHIVAVVSFLVLVLIWIVQYKNLLKNISFKRYVNQSNNTLEDIIADLSKEFLLVLYTKGNSVFIMNYRGNSLFNIFKIKKQVNLILDGNAILINIRNSNEMDLYSFNDIQEHLFLESLKRKIQSDSKVKKYKIDNLLLSKN